MLSEMIRHADRLAHRDRHPWTGRALPVNADAGQFETAIINMAVNARDAMDGQGRLTIAVGVAASLPRRRPLSAKSIWLCCRIRRGYRNRHSARPARTHLRTVLHHQAGRPWHGARPVAGVRLRQAIRRRSDRRQRGRQRQYVFTLYLPRIAGGGQTPADAGGRRPGDRRPRHVGARGRGQSRGREICHRCAGRTRLHCHAGRQRHACARRAERGRRPLRCRVHRRGHARHDRHRARARKFAATIPACRSC